MNEITRILTAIEQGERQATDKLLPLVYEELRELAGREIAKEQPGQSLDATALVHEAYLRLVKPQDDARWEGRGHFFAAAAIAMRRILIENARRRARIKHGGEYQRVPVGDLPATGNDERLLALDAALTCLAEEDSQAAKIVELHHFAGLSHELVAKTLGVSVYQARQMWAYARAWLQTELENS
jgi:RNA polymerase sigma factor (TIGR02999 family)